MTNVKIEENWYPFEIDGEVYHLQVRIDDFNKDEVMVCVWDWDKGINQMGNQITKEWRICSDEEVCS